MIHAVPDPDDSSMEDANVRSHQHIPKFEGREVNQAKIKIGGAAKVPFDDVIISVDDRVRIVGEYKVTGIRHYVDEATGDLVREQIIRPIDETIMLAPWDPQDPKDDGVIRARVR